MSGGRKKIIRTRLGVKLERLEEGCSRRGRKVLFRLSSRRAAADRLILDEAEAQRAFAREVAACLVDPHIRTLAKRGIVRD